MVDRVMAQFDFQDADTEEFFCKGLQARYQKWDGARLTSVLWQYGSYLTYKEELSEKDAALLRRLFSTGPPVGSLYIRKISANAFRIAFQGQGECPSLRAVIFYLLDCERRDLGIDRCEVLKNVRSLDLACVNVGSRYAQEIVSYIRHNESLEELGLHLTCGGDRCVADIMETLKVNDTLKEFGLFNIGSFTRSQLGNNAWQLSSDAIIGIAEMLASNSSLEVVDVRDAFPVEKEKVSSLLAQERHAGVFRRIFIEWPEQLLPELTELVRKEACYPKLHVIVSSSVDRGILQEFLDAVATHKTLLELHFSPPRTTSVPYHHQLNNIPECIVSVLKHSTTLREVYNCVPADRGQLISVLDALKENRSVTRDTLDAKVLTGEVAKSLAELLAVNRTLVYVCIMWSPGVLPREMEDVRNALRTNYTLNTINFGFDADPRWRDVETLLDSGFYGNPVWREVEALLERNVRLMNRAAEFVASGADVSDEEGVDALKKVQASATLVERMRDLTGKTTEAALQEIQSALVRLPA